MDLKTIEELNKLADMYGMSNTLHSTIKGLLKRSYEDGQLDKEIEYINNVFIPEGIKELWIKTGNNMRTSFSIEAIREALRQAEGLKG